MKNVHPNRSFTSTVRAMVIQCLKLKPHNPSETRVSNKIYHLPSASKDFAMQEETSLKEDLLYSKGDNSPARESRRAG